MRWVSLPQTLLQLLHSMEHGDAVKVQEHDGKLVLTEQDEVGLDELRILEHVGGNLCLCSPSTLALGPVDGYSLQHVQGYTES